MVLTFHFFTSFSLFSPSSSHLLCSFFIMFSPVRARSLSVQAPPPVQAPRFVRVPEFVQFPQTAQAPQPVQEASDTNLKHLTPHLISTPPQEPASTAIVLASRGDPFTRLEEGQIFESSIIPAESVRRTSQCSRQSG